MEKMDKQAIYKLHQKYSHGVFKDKLLEIGWNHSLIVAEIAIQIADRIKREYKIEVDRKLLETGALIHDIGFYSCFDDKMEPKSNYTIHGLLGYDIAKKDGLGEQIARFCLCHTTTGITKEDVNEQKMPMEARDYIPITLEEEIVSYADIFHSKGHPKLNKYDDQLRKFPKFSQLYPQVMERFKKKFGLPDLLIIEKRYKKWHKEINNWIDQKYSENH
jgi:uncharacterized protein